MRSGDNAERIRFLWLNREQRESNLRARGAVPDRSCLTAIAVLFACQILGCAAPGYFLVLRDVPAEPAFVVLPFNTGAQETTYADRVEQALLASRVSVRSRPNIKVIGTERELRGSGAENPGASVMIEGQTLSESYVEWGAVDADFIIRTHAAARRLKVENAASGEILTVFEVRTDLERALNIALSELGLAERRVKLSPPEQEWIPIRAPRPPPPQKERPQGWKKRP